MKKENVFTKIFVPALEGFVLGIALLMMTYVAIFLIAGENVANNELVQIQNVRTLVFQMMAAGLAYFIILGSINIILYFKNNETSSKVVSKHPITAVLVALVAVLGIVVAITLVTLKGVFTENVATINCAIMAIIYAGIALVFMIKDVIDNLIVKSMNKKIKERNKDTK